MEGVHPPFYYLIIHYWSNALAKIGIEFTLAARGLSLFFALLALITLNFCMRHFASWKARVLATTLIVSSGVWVYFSQEARSYALVQFLVLVILFWTHGFTIGSKQLSIKSLVGFVLLCTLASVIHLYATIVSGGACFVLLITSNSNRDRALVVIGGLIILVSAVAVAKWTSIYTVIPPEDNWVKGNFLFVFRNFLLFLTILIIPFSHIPPILLSAAALLRQQMNAPNSAWQEKLKNVESVTVLIFFFTLTTSVAASILVTPVFTFKLSFVLAPLFWVLLLLGIDAALQLERQKVVSAVILISALISATLTHAPFVPMKEEWRASSEFVDSIQGCKGESIPIVVHEAEVAGKSYSELFFGFYLQDAQSFTTFARRDLWLPRSELFNSPAINQLADHLKEIVRDENFCPVVLWDGHYLTEQMFREIRSVLQPHVPQEWRLNIVNFGAASELLSDGENNIRLPAKRWGLRRLKWGQARVLVLEAL